MESATRSGLLGFLVIGLVVSAAVGLLNGLLTTIGLAVYHFWFGVSIAGHFVGLPIGPVLCSLPVAAAYYYGGAAFRLRGNGLSGLAVLIVSVVAFFLISWFIYQLLLPPDTAMSYSRWLSFMAGRRILGLALASPESVANIRLGMAGLLTIAFQTLAYAIPGWIALAQLETVRASSSNQVASEQAKQSPPSS
jgi:hypothetical protein